MVREKEYDNKQCLKRKRMKMYFQEAAKEMIVSEGVECVSVRKVAEAAGYSYGTLYIYFEDLNELLWEVKRGMIKGLVEIIQKKMQNVRMDNEGLKKLFRTYMGYYFENPNIFKFFYFYKLTQPARVSEDMEEEPDFDGMMRETFRGFVSGGKMQEKDIETVGKLLIYTIHGMLTLYFSGNGELREESVYTEFDKVIDYLL